MKIDKIINKYLLDEKRMSIKEIADEVEDMDLNVTKEDSKKFSNVLNKALNKVDPDNTLSIKKAVMKLKMRDAIALLDDLSDFTYDN